MKKSTVRVVLLLTLLLTLAVQTFAEAPLAPGQKLAYRDGQTELAGEYYVPASASGKLPAVIVFHDWMGISDVTRAAAQDITKMGYVAVLADVYGVGIRPTTVPAAAEASGNWKKDRPSLRRRALAAIAATHTLSIVDSSKMVLIGYCFGGTVALEAGRAGAPVQGIVSLHGGLETPDITMAKNIRSPILALHGADDPFVPATEVAAFEAELRAAKVDWQLISYGGAVHAFTNEAVDALKLPGAAYHKPSANRARLAMQQFFREVLGR